MWDVGKLNISYLMWDEDLGTQANKVVNCSVPLAGAFMEPSRLSLAWHACQMRQGLRRLSVLLTCYSPSTERSGSRGQARRRMSNGLDQGSEDSVLLVDTFWLVYNMAINSLNLTYT